MEKRSYFAPDIDVEELGHALYEWFTGQGFETQLLPTQGGAFTVQARKESTWRVVTGMSNALTIVMQSDGESIHAEAGGAKWIDKGAAGAVGMLIFWPALITAGVGAYQQTQLQTRAWEFIAGYIRTHSRQAGPMPTNVGRPPQMTAAAPAGAGMAGPPPPVNLAGRAAPAGGGELLACAQCGRALRAGSKFCDSCGAPTSQSCPGCGHTLRAGAKFCDKCGAPLGR